MTQELEFGTEGSEAETAANGKDQLMWCVPGGQKSARTQTDSRHNKHPPPTQQ